MPFHFSSLVLLAISALPLLKNYFRDAAILQFLFIKLEEVKVCKNHIVPVVSAVWTKNLMVINGLSLIKISHMCEGKYNFLTLYTLCFCSSLRMLHKTWICPDFLQLMKTFFFSVLKYEEGLYLFSTRKNEKPKCISTFFSHLNSISISSTFFSPDHMRTAVSLLALLRSC